MQCALESFEASKHGRRLNEVDMFVQNLRETVACCPDDALSGLTILVNMVRLDSQ